MPRKEAARGGVEPRQPSALAPEQQNWADEHTGKEATVAITGRIIGHEVDDDGMVTFTVQAYDGQEVTFQQRPPLTQAQQEEQQRAREEAERRAIAAEEAQIEDRIQAAVNAALAAREGV